MPPRNPLRDDDQPQKVIRGETFTNLRTEQVARIIGPDGAVTEMDLGSVDSRLDPNGGYVDRTETNIYSDQAGNILPEDGRPVALSHTGLFITTPEQLTQCTSVLHFPWQSRNILVGQDGQVLDENHAICSHCQANLTTIYIVLGILVLGVVIGLLQGTGVF